MHDGTFTRSAAGQIPVIDAGVGVRGYELDAIIQPRDALQWLHVTSRCVCVRVGVWVYELDVIIQPPNNTLRWLHVTSRCVSVSVCVRERGRQVYHQLRKLHVVKIMLQLHTHTVHMYLYTYIWIYIIYTYTYVSIHTYISIHTYMCLVPLLLTTTKLQENQSS